MTLTDILAAYGAVLSTGVFLWTVTHSKPVLRVRLVHSVETNDGVTKAGLRIEVQNPSLHKAHLQSVLLVYPFRRAPWREHLVALFRYRQLPPSQNWCHTSLSNLGVDDGCPVSIEPHQAHSIFIEHELLEDYLEDRVGPYVKVVAQDALWRNRYSRRMEYP